MAYTNDGGGGSVGSWRTEPTPVMPMVCFAPHDWSRYSLDAIWSMLHGQNRANGQIAAEMWRKMAELCEIESTQLELALGRLEQHWPATQEAARMFQQWGADLVKAMRGTSFAARVNGPTVENITEEINAARDKIANLQGEAVKYVSMEQAGGSNGFGIAHVWNVGSELFSGDGFHPFTGWRDTLNQDAQEVMFDLERKVETYSQRLLGDVPYEPALSSGGVEVWPPPGSGPSGGGGGGTQLPSVSWTPPAPPAGWDPAAGGDLPGGGASVDPTLDGDTVLDGGPSPTGGGGPGPLGGPGGGWAGSFVDTPGGRALAPGGLIGVPGAMGSGAGGVGTPGGPAGPGGPGVAGRPGGAGSGMMPFMPPMAGARPGVGGAPTAVGAKGRRRRGLKSVFEVPEGQPAVIRPSEEPPEHDPGPGVIGIDR